MTTTVKLGSFISETYSIKDSASSEYGNKDGFTLCGPRTYSLTGSYTAHNSITTSGNAVTIKLKTELDADITHTTNGVDDVLKTCLKDYTDT